LSNLTDTSINIGIHNNNNHTTTSIITDIDTQLQRQTSIESDVHSTVNNIDIQPNQEQIGSMNQSLIYEEFVNNNDALNDTLNNILHQNKNVEEEDNESSDSDPILYTAPDINRPIEEIEIIEYNDDNVVIEDHSDIMPECLNELTEQKKLIENTIKTAIENIKNGNDSFNDDNQEKTISNSIFETLDQYSELRDPTLTSSVISSNNESSIILNSTVNSNVDVNEDFFTPDTVLENIQENDNNNDSIPDSPTVSNKSISGSNSPKLASESDSKTDIK
jgi:hypothetical protein